MATHRIKAIFAAASLAFAAACTNGAGGGHAAGGSGNAAADADNGAADGRNAAADGGNAAADVGADSRTIAELAARVQKLEDVLAIQKLQAKYVSYLFLQRYDRIFEELYAQKNPDVSVEFSDSGIYRGPESVRALYHGFDVTKKIPGFFLMHMAVDPYIEVAADGRSARSQWLSPGITGSNTSAGWVFGPYYVDYVKEDSEWRILHSNLAPIVRTSFDVSWAKATDNGTVRGVLPVEPDGPSTLYRPYAERKKEPDMFKDFPDLPKPY